MRLFYEIESYNDSPMDTSIYMRLHADLDQRVGKEIQRSKYEKYNQLDKINEAIVVYENNVLVGAGSIRCFDEINVELKRIYISPAFRGQGLGTKLVSLLMECANDLVYHMSYFH